MPMQEQDAGTSREEAPADSTPSALAGRQRYTRRLSDKIMIAFHSACDIGDHATAAGLLRVVESVLTRARTTAGPDRRRNVESLVAGYYRLWALTHESDGEPIPKAGGRSLPSGPIPRQAPPGL